jgi:hypothetical protein
MRKEDIAALVKLGSLRPKQKDMQLIGSMIIAAETNARVAEGISLTEDSATLIFNTIYDSIRSLGTAKWLLTGYEPTSALGNHELCLSILKEMDIKKKIKLNFLDRFRMMRHDEQYRAFRVSISQAKEIIDFWDSCGKEIIKLILAELK